MSDIPIMIFFSLQMSCPYMVCNEQESLKTMRDNELTVGVYV